MSDLQINELHFGLLSILHVCTQETFVQREKRAQVEMILAPVIDSPFYSCETKLMAFFLFTNC